MVIILQLFDSSVQFSTFQGAEKLASIKVIEILIKSSNKFWYRIKWTNSITFSLGEYLCEISLLLRPRDSQLISTTNKNESFFASGLNQLQNGQHSISNKILDQSWNSCRSEYASKEAFRRDCRSTSSSSWDENIWAINGIWKCPPSPPPLSQIYNESTRVIDTVNSVWIIQTILWLCAFDASNGFELFKQSAPNIQVEMT